MSYPVFILVFKKVPTHMMAGHNAYQYAMTSIITGMLIMIAILGSYVWNYDGLIATNGAC